MNENDDMIFWDDMWNMSGKKLKKIITKHENTSEDSVEDTQVEPKD